MANETPVTSCASCPVGRAAGVGAGGRCPLVERSRARGSFVYLEGEAATRVWFVKRGCVVLTRSHHEAGADAPHSLRRAGSFIGLEALVRAAYLDTARVAADAVLCSGSREAVDGWLRQVAPLRMALELVLEAGCGDAPRLCKADGSADERVARWLLAEAVPGGPTPVPRRYTAGLLGMVPETFSRVLARLARLGAIEVTRRTLVVRDPAVLRGIAARERSS